MQGSSVRGGQDCLVPDRAHSSQLQPTHYRTQPSPRDGMGALLAKCIERKGKNDTEVVRIEGGKSEKQPCEMGTGGKRVKEQVFPKEWKKPWKT